jgi:hypothetical protein
MNQREHDDASLLDTVEHGVWKAANSNAPKIAVHDGIAFRMLSCGPDGAIDLDDKFRAETQTLFLVPQCGLVEFRLRDAPKDNCESHAFRRLEIEA